MATTTEDLTESQIDALLREAEERLIENEKTHAATVAASARPFQVAQVAKNETEAAVASKEVVARKTDDVTIRVAQAEKKKNKVRLTEFSRFHELSFHTPNKLPHKTRNDENYPNKIEASGDPVMGEPLQTHDFIYIIVTLISRSTLPPFLHPSLSLFKPSFRQRC